MSTTRKINEAAKLTTVPASSLIAVASATGQLTPVSYSDLLAQLRQDLLDGKQVGFMGNRLMTCYEFPSRTTLQNIGYLAATSSDTEDFFRAMLRKMADEYCPTGGVFYGRATPNSAGLCGLYIYAVAQNATTHLPENCVGFHFHWNGHICIYGTKNGTFWYKEVTGA